MVGYFNLIYLFFWEFHTCVWYILIISTPPLHLALPIFTFPTPCSISYPHHFFFCLFCNPLYPAGAANVYMGLIHPLKHGQPSGNIPEESWIFILQIPSIVKSFHVGMRPRNPLLHPCWYANCPNLLPGLLSHSQLLWQIHEHNGPAMSRKHCFIPVLPSL